MQSSNEQVIHQLHDWLMAGRFCWLVTIAATWGSSPRPAGSLLVWSEQEAVGSLSGGCVEDELLEKLAHDEFAPDRIHQVTYGIPADETSRLRLPCGGTLSLILEPLAPTAANQTHAATMITWLQQRQGFIRSTPLNGSKQLSTLQPSSPAPNQRVADHFHNYLGPRYRLLLIGANQVAEFLADFAQALDFDVLVCDPRPGAFDQWPHNFTRNLTNMPDDVVRDLAQDSLSAIITLSHDPRVDDMALMEALTTDAFYVGAMGSIKTTEKRLQRLQQLDLTPAHIARLHAPVGLDIGSKTPAEIALSIAADLIRHIRKKTGATCPDV